MQTIQPDLVLQNTNLALCSAALRSAVLGLIEACAGFLGILSILGPCRLGSWWPR
jgi:hypothetical protein